MDPNNATSERNQLLKRFESFFEFPMVVLGFVWLVLLIIELVYQTTPLLETFGVVIWVIFILDFVVKFALVPDKKLFLKKNVLTVISLVVLAFRGLNCRPLLQTASLLII